MIQPKKKYAPKSQRYREGTPIVLSLGPASNNQGEAQSTIVLSLGPASNNQGEAQSMATLALVHGHRTSCLKTIRQCNISNKLSPSITTKQNSIRFASNPVNGTRLCCTTKALGEEEAAARAVGETEGPTIFDKIIAKEIPATIVYEDDKVLAFKDINPQAPVHILIIPKERDGLTMLSKAESRHSAILGHMLYTAKVVAEQEGVSNGYRIVINNGPTACQSVYHLHLHLMGGRQMKWPAG